MSKMEGKKRPAGVYVALAILVVGVGLSIVADWLGSPFLKSLALVLPCGLAGYAVSVYMFDITPFRTTAGRLFYAAIILLVTIAFWLIDIY